MRRTVFGADQATNRAILIRVRNAAELARSQGALGTLAAALVPGTVEAKVYDEMKAKLVESLKANNVDADVSVVEPKNFKSPTNSHLAHDAVVGAVAIGGVIGFFALIYHFVVGRHHKK
jgi:hypothetical protein